MPRTTTAETESFTDAEKEAMKERAKETRRGKKGDKVSGEQALLKKVAEMPEPDRVLATRIHEIVTATAPSLSPKTWYGMPAYANAAGKVVCFFQGAAKFDARYATLGFNDSANLDDGEMWPTSWALTELTPEVEARIAALVKQVAS